MTNPAPTLPATCADCVYHVTVGRLCRRHAPGPTTETCEITRWPVVRPTSRCGAGAAVGDGDGPGPVQCGWCVHWLQPDGQGVIPDYPQGFPRAWWEQSGYCTRHAPSPSAEEDRLTEWRVVHVHDACGDGVRVPDAAEDGLPEAPAVREHEVVQLALEDRR